MNSLRPEILLWFFMLVIFGSCTGLKQTVATDPLYVGNTYKIAKSNKRAKQIIEDANASFRPNPNQTFLRIHQSIHYP